jgi:hypothetical protein
MFFKIINDLVDIPSSNYLIPANSKMRSNHSKKMHQYHTQSDVFKYRQTHKQCSHMVVVTYRLMNEIIVTNESEWAENMYAMFACYVLFMLLS